MPEAVNGPVINASLLVGVKHQAAQYISPEDNLHNCGGTNELMLATRPETARRYR